MKPTYCTVLIMECIHYSKYLFHSVIDFHNKVLLFLLQFTIQLHVVNIMICLTAGNHGDWMVKEHIKSQYLMCDVLMGVNISSPLPSWQHDCPIMSSSCDHIDILLIQCKHHMIQGEVIISMM